MLRKTWLMMTATTTTVESCLGGRYSPAGGLGGVEEHLVFLLVEAELDEGPAAEQWVEPIRHTERQTVKLLVKIHVQEVSRSNPGILPMLHACREHDRLPRWPLRGQQVSHQRWIWGTHFVQVRKHARDGSTLALKPRAQVTRNPKQGYQWAHKKDLCPLKIF